MVVAFAYMSTGTVWSLPLLTCRLEQYGRCLCLRVDDIPAVSYESRDDVMNLMRSLFKEAKVSVPENVLDRAH